MGNDGGSIPRRCELVKTKKKATKLDPSTKIISQWFYCALSKKPLESPVVVCQLGKLYNKETLLEYFINKKIYGDADKICSHVKSLSKVKTLNFMDNPLYKGTQSESKPIAPFVCPLTLKEMNGNQKFVYLSPCGCVFSELGLKQMQQHDLTCPSCSKSYTSDQVTEIWPSQETQDKLMLEIHSKREALLKKKRAQETSETEVAQNNSSLVVKKMKTGAEPTTPSNSQSLVKHITETSKLKEKSAAIKSIYTSSTSNQDAAKKQNYLCRGTFNRYS